MNSPIQGAAADIIKIAMIRVNQKLKKQKILIRDCSNYKGLGEGYYRVCMRQRGDNQKLIDALGEILYAGQGEF